jgi:DNA-binding CsgD family transcriptional regulator
MVVADEAGARRGTTRVFGADRPRFTNTAARMGRTTDETLTVAPANPLALDPRRALMDRLAAISTLTESATEDAERLSRASRYMEYIGEEAEADVLRWNLVAEASQELVYCLPGPLPARRLSELRASLTTAVSGGTEIIFVCAASVFRNGQNLTFLTELAESGARIHQIDTDIIDLVIVDRRVALLPADQDRASQGYMVVAIEAVVEILRAFALLPNARRLDSPDSRRHLERSETLRKVAVSLNSHATDEIAARSVRTSVRTFRRHVADLMRELGAESRFQAGVAAARQGLVP